MAEEEEVVAVSSPAPVDHHKRKLEDLEPEETTPASDGEHVENGVTAKEVSDASEAKRPRVVDYAEPEDLAGEGGNENGKEETPQLNNSQSGEALEVEQPLTEEVSIIENAEPSVQEDEQKVNSQPDGVQLPSSTEQSENVVKPSEDDPLPVTEIPQLGETDQNLAESGTQTISRKMEVPNQMVGVLIGKAGDTIRNLQFNSGAKIQITRDADADPGATTRPVELIGTLACINKAEKLIKEVIAEADAGGSPALVARGFTLAAGVMEQIEIQVPNDKVGLVIGKGGETIKSLQTRSGARIQLVPQHLPEGDRSKERTVRVSGDKKQIDMARELIKEVMNQNIKQSTYVSNYGQQQQSYRPRGPPGPVPQWGPPRPHNAPSMPYDYHQHRGGAPYPSQNQHYPTPYGNYPPQGPPRGNFNSGWEHRPPPQMQGPPSHTGGYDYYNAQGVPPSAPRPSMPSHPQPNYNYGQQPLYSQTQPQQSYQASQPSNIPYQAPVSVAPSYGQTVVPAQQPYPYASSVPSTTTTNDGYNQQPQQQQTGYPQQVATSQPAAGFSQPGPGGYPQQAYGQYPQTQQGGAYSNQTQAYGYQGQPDPSAYAAPQVYSSAPPQAAAYAQPAAATHQGGYEQAGAYPPAAAVAQPAGGYPQQQYDASQMYGASG